MNLRPIAAIAISAGSIVGAGEFIYHVQPNTPVAHEYRLHGMGLIPSGVTKKPQPLPRSAKGDLPSSANLDSTAPPVRDQGQYGDCASNASTNDLYSMQVLVGQSPSENYSPMFQYVQIVGVNNPNQGTSFPDNLNIQQTQGAVKMSQYHGGAYNAMYDDANLPTAQDKANAGGPKITGSRELFQTYPNGGGVAGEDQIKSAIDQGYPVIIGFNVRDPYEHYNGSGEIQPGGSTLYGGHANVAYSYDANGLNTLNSWSANWGDRGWAHLSWGFVEQELWWAYIITGVTGQVAPSPTPLPLPTATPFPTPKPLPTAVPTVKPTPNPTPVPVNVFPVARWNRWRLLHNLKPIPYTTNGSIRKIARAWWKDTYKGRPLYEVCAGVQTEPYNLPTASAQIFVHCALSRATVNNSITIYVPGSTYPQAVKS